MKNNKDLWVYVVAAILAIIAVIFYTQKQEYKRKNKENISLIEALEDSMTVWTDKEGKLHSKIQVLETQSVKDFLNLKIKDEEIVALQDQVRKYRKELKDQGSVTNITTEVKYDTTYIYHSISGDTVILSQTKLMDNITNKWMDIDFGFDKGFSVLKINSFINNYSVVIGRERQGIFKPYKPFAEVISDNPYTTVTSMRTYQVSLPRPRKWGLGFQAGYGGSLVDNKVYLAPYIGVGINYNLLSW